MTLEEMIQEAHNTAKEKGFWEKPDLSMKLSLICCEISEMIEEYRLPEEQHGGKLSEILYEAPLPRNVEDGDGGRWTQSQVNKYQSFTGNKNALLKPVGFLVEAADIAIRCFDLAGASNKIHFLASIRDNWIAAQVIEFDKREIGKVFIDLYDFVVQGQYNGYNDGLRNLGKLYCVLAGLIKFFGGDLDKAIEIKMAYNKSRPHMHGKRC